MQKRRLLASWVAICLSGGSTAGAAVVNSSPATASQPVQFSVYLPLQNVTSLEPLLAEQQNPASPSYHKWLTPAQFNALFGPTAASIANVEAALKAQGFAVLGASGRAIQVSGTAAMVSQAFATSLSNAQSGAGETKLMATSALVMPAALQAEGAMIPAFSGQARLHTHSQRAAISVPANRYGPDGGYWFDDLKQAYGYPSYQTYDGTGVNVAILMSSDALDSDIAKVFDHEKFTSVTGKPDPTITHLPLDQKKLAFTAAVDEASLDVQQVLGGAPGAEVTLVDIPDLMDTSIIDGYSYIVNAETSARATKFQIVSSSFGGCELDYTAAFNNGKDMTYLLRMYQDLFNQGNAEGITFVASSGDSGGLGCPDVNYASPTATAPSRFIVGVEFPASSQNVTAVGGGNLITNSAPPSLASTYVAENAFGDPEFPFDPYGLGANVYGGYWGAGGGVSAVFTKPSYQSLVNTGSTAYRTLPDIGMQVGGCPGAAIQPCGPHRSYVIVSIQGTFYGLIGTSVAAPEFAGALALYVQKMGGGVGNINTYLYEQAAKQNAHGGLFYNRNIPGYDGRYSSTSPSGGYDYLVGNGTPQISNLFGMQAAPMAGDPRTPSNP